MRSGLRRLGLLRGLGLRGLGLCGLGLCRLSLCGLGLRFGSRLGLPVGGGLFLVGFFQRDLLLDRFLLARRFLIGPLLAGWRVIGRPRRGRPVQC
jgi:hypothetical protein